MNAKEKATIEELEKKIQSLITENFQLEERNESLALDAEELKILLQKKKQLITVNHAANNKFAAKIDVKTFSRYDIVRHCVSRRTCVYEIANFLKQSYLNSTDRSKSQSEKKKHLFHLYCFDRAEKYLRDVLKEHVTKETFGKFLSLKEYYNNVKTNEKFKDFFEKMIEKEKKEYTSLKK
jgi:hypothetical protein